MNIQQGLAALQIENLGRVVSLARRKLEQEGKPVILSDDEAEMALRQYYAMPLLEHPRQKFAISATVDHYWHCHVLDTREYRDFCRRVYGCFMHHVPMDPDDSVDFVRVRRLYQQTRGMLVKHFGSNVSERAYPLLRGSGQGVIICTYDYCITADLFDSSSQLHYTTPAEAQVA